ncbi:hypothetical protein EXN66_Car010471 [Channa argus]|uniref:Uncharacterized protein n=1 Tax=Channa argus TaxID=215402 RepID=A0A6G1PWZ1_CHAAH|nr:hypothetical protein EXN66_Car010471 [Channa argus]
MRVGISPACCAQMLSASSDSAAFTLHHTPHSPSGRCSYQILQIRTLQNFPIKQKSLVQIDQIFLVVNISSLLQVMFNESVSWQACTASLHVKISSGAYFN